MKTKKLQKKVSMNALPTVLPMQPTDWQCHSCEHDSHEILSDLPATEYTGVKPDGTQYTSVQRQRVKCHQCGQISIHVRHQYDASKWRG